MTRDEIDAEARHIAHEHTTACKNRPAVYAGQGHGKACDRLTAKIRDAMLKAAAEATP